MAFTAVDRALLQRCLNREPGAWNDFVDRFLGLIYHVIHYTAHLRSVPLRPEDTEDLAAEILLQIVANDYAVLRQFKGNSSLATYLTVIARRICVHELARRTAFREAQPKADGRRVPEAEVEEPPRAQVSRPPVLPRRADLRRDKHRAAHPRQQHRPNSHARSQEAATRAGKIAQRENSPAGTRRSPAEEQRGLNAARFRC